MKPILCSTCLSLSLVLPALAATVGGIDPATAPATFVSDTAGNFLVISNQFVHATTDPETIDLSISSFRYQSNANAGAGATPFLAVQTGLPDSHLIGDYDVIWIGENLTNAAGGTDVSAPLGLGNFVLPGNSTIVGGYFASGGGAQLSPASAVFASGAPSDVLIIAQATVGIDTNIAITGTNWSTNPAVTNRLYHYQIVLEQSLPDADGDGLPDEWEDAHGLDPQDNGENPNNQGVPGDPVNGALGDPDGDGLDNAGEFHNGSDPRDDDSDDDTLLDNDEVLGAGLRPPTSPVNADSDDDGLSDLVETNTGVFVDDADTGSNPLEADSDSDGTADGAEIAGTNPGRFTSNPNLADTDGDGYDDTTEYALGTDPSDAGSFPTTVFIGDAAPQTVAVSDAGVPDGANVGNLTYALHGSPYTNSSGGAEEFTVSMAHFWADGAGDVTPFVTLYNGLGVGPAANYTILAIGDVIAATPGEVNHAEFTVDGEPATIILEDGQTVLAGFHQTARVVPFGQPGDADPDFLDIGLTLGAVGSGFLEDANWNNLPRSYAFNIALEPGSGARFEIAGITVDTATSSATVTWNSRPGRLYALWVSGDLETWAELDDSLVGEDGATTSFTESPLPPGAGRRYYQVRVP